MKIRKIPTIEKKKPAKNTDFGINESGKLVPMTRSQWTDFVNKSIAEYKGDTERASTYLIRPKIHDYWKEGMEDQVVLGNMVFREIVPYNTAKDSLDKALRKGKWSRAPGEEEYDDV